jgi:hypothetical protein
MTRSRPGSLGRDAMQDLPCHHISAAIQTRWECGPAHMVQFLDLRPSAQRCHIRTIKLCLALRTVSRLAGGGTLPVS